MASRVTEVEVRSIIETELTDLQVLSYITSANVLVNSMFGVGVTDVLKEIEKWLTAHLITITRDRQAIEEAAGTAKVKYSDIFGEGLRSTTYGQMVLTLDSSGLLLTLYGKRAMVYAIPSFN